MEHEKTKIERHTSKQFDVELEDVREQVLTMGGLVEQQIANGVKALIDGDSAIGEDVARSDYKINTMEVAIDEAFAVF